MTLDLDRMQLSTAKALTGTVTTDAPLALTLAGGTDAVTVTIDGAAVAAAPSGRAADRGRARRQAHGRRHARLIRSAARSATIIVGAFVLPPGITGNTDASATRRPATPRTRSSGSSTAWSSSAAPIRQVPTGW